MGALLVGVTHMNHFIVETKEGKRSFDDAPVPPNPTHPPCQFSVKCTKSDYYCPKNDYAQCQRPREECKCTGCHRCLLVSCLKKKLGCKLGKGKPGKLCSAVGLSAVC